MPDTCYLCGATAELTRDHIPPKGFFPRPLPANLITVPCCRTCNGNWGKEDEAIRAFFTLVLGRSEAGDAIWDGRAMPRIVERNPKLRDFILDRTQHFNITTPAGIESVPVFDPPHEMIERFLVRITKGFLRFYYPRYDYSQSVFTVKPFPLIEPYLEALKTILACTRYDERGDGVIWYRYGISDTERSGLWFYVFYGATSYLVHHERPSTND